MFTALAAAVSTVYQLRATSEVKEQEVWKSDTFSHSFLQKERKNSYRLLLPDVATWTQDFGRWNCSHEQQF